LFKQLQDSPELVGQLVASVNAEFSTGYAASSQFSFVSSMRSSE